jgi:hypothetical protein
MLLQAHKEYSQVHARLRSHTMADGTNTGVGGDTRGKLLDFNREFVASDRDGTASISVGVDNARASATFAWARLLLLRRASPPCCVHPEDPAALDKEDSTESFLEADDADTKTAAATVAAMIRILGLPF